MNEMKCLLIAMSTVCAAIFSSQAVPLKISNASFEETQDGACVGWRLSSGMRQNAHAGSNGSGGLVWESAGPNARQDFAASGRESLQFLCHGTHRELPVEEVWRDNVHRMA